MPSRPSPAAHWTAAIAISLGAFSILPSHARAAADAIANGARISTEGANGAPACMACHGPHGEGNPPVGFPRLAGASAHYLAQQLEALADGSRASPVMAAIAQALDPAQRQTVAQYYAALPSLLDVDRLAATAQRPVKADDTGAWLATRGAWDKNVPACNQCHGPGGIGVGDHFPSLAGQPAAYLAGQLRAWRDKQRPPGPLALMSGIAARLTDAEIDAVSAYYANLPKATDMPAAQPNPAEDAKP